MADEKKGMNPVAVGLAGAVVGAAAAAGAIVLSDEKNRQKLEKALESLKKQGFKVMDIVQKEAAEMKKIATQRGNDEMVKEAKKAVKKAAK